MKERKLKSVIGEYILEIPDYQRGYAWDVNQWKDFVDDIDALVDESLNSHYTGTIVLYVPRNPQDRVMKQYGKRNTYPIAEVIDGQQRITSISLYLAAIINRLIMLGVDDCREERDEYLYRNGQCRLLLNNNTDDIYYELISSGTTKHPTTTSHQNRLKDAYAFFDNHIRQCSQDRLELLLSAITNKLNFSSYVIDDQSEVGMTFELMNSRGKDLTHLELLKNYLMYWVNRNAPDDIKGSLIRNINITWKNVYQNLQKESEEFQCLRIAWILLCTYVPKEWDGYNGFKRDDIIPIRNFSKKSKECVVKFIEEFNYVLSSVSMYYAQILLAEQATEKQTKWLSKIKRAGNIANFIPLMVVAKMKLEKGQIEEREYIQLLQCIETYSYRVFLWQGRRSNSGLTNFFRWSYELYISDAPAQTLSSIIDSVKVLTTYYLPEKSFIEDCYKISPWYTASKRALKYTLYEYELYLLEVEGKGVSPKLRWNDIQDSTLEHILPQTPGENSQWVAKWSDENRALYLHDISNIVLTFDNSHYLNFDFTTKKGVAGSGHCYANSDIRQERKISEYPDWTQSECQNRKEALSKWICERWGICSVESEKQVNIDDEE